MPTYTYRCNNCEYQFDVRQRMADEPLTDCPECNTNDALRKVLNSVGIVFKGSGFYITDSRGKKSAAAPSVNGKSGENGSDGNSANGSSANDNNAKAEPSTHETHSKPEAKADNGSGKGKTEKTAV
jgi:putative FmdB family regulatory protein